MLFNHQNYWGGQRMCEGATHPKRLDQKPSKTILFADNNYNITHVLHVAYYKNTFIFKTHDCWRTGILRNKIVLFLSYLSVLKFCTATLLKTKYLVIGIIIFF